MFSFDDFISDAYDRAEDAFSNFGSTVIQSGLEQIGFLKVGATPNQNLTAKQVEMGQTAGPRESSVMPRDTPENSQLKNSFGFPNLGGLSPMIILGFLGLALLLRR